MLNRVEDVFGGEEGSALGQSPLIQSEGHGMMGGAVELERRRVSAIVTRGRDRLFGLKVRDETHPSPHHPFRHLILHPVN